MACTGQGGGALFQCRRGGAVRLDRVHRCFGVFLGLVRPGGAESVVDRTRAEEGDLVRLISRTGEALRQLANLRTHDETAALARDASDALLREPVR